VPVESTTIPVGNDNDALVAGPPSPENARVPVPAIVVIVPFDTFRIRLLYVSAM
jgi:hypothetical protein